jgi:hypothetical protein
MKKSIAIILSIGALVAMIVEMTPTNMKVHGEEAHHNPALQVEYIENDPTGWAVAEIGMGLGGLIAAIGLWLFAREVPRISDNKNIQMASYLAAALVVIGALVHAVTRYNGVVLPPEEILNDFNTPSWMYPTYTLFTRIAFIITGYVLLKSGYSKKLGWVMIGLSGLFLLLMGITGPPGVYTLVFLIMGITLLFKRSPSPQELSQTAQIKSAVS